LELLVRRVARYGRFVAKTLTIKKRPTRHRIPTPDAPANPWMPWKSVGIVSS
jgi:hypothetical protein